MLQVDYCLIVPSMKLDELRRFVWRNIPKPCQLMTFAKQRRLGKKCSSCGFSLKKACDKLSRLPPRRSFASFKMINGKASFIQRIPPFAFTHYDTINRVCRMIRNHLAEKLRKEGIRFNRVTF